MLVSVDCLFSFRLWFSWFLVWWVVFLLNPGCFSYHVRKWWVLLSLNLLFKPAFTLLGFNMWVLDSSGGPWLNNSLVFRAFACAVLVFLFCLVTQRLPMISAAALWGGRRSFQRPSCLRPLGVEKRESPAYGTREASWDQCLWRDPSLLMPLGCSASLGGDWLAETHKTKRLPELRCSCGLIPLAGAALPWLF